MMKSCREKCNTSPPGGWLPTQLLCIRLQGASPESVEEMALAWAKTQPQLSAAEMWARDVVNAGATTDQLRGRSAAGNGARDSSPTPGAPAKRLLCHSCAQAGCVACFVQGVSGMLTTYNLLGRRLCSAAAAATCCSQLTRARRP